MLRRISLIAASAAIAAVSALPASAATTHSSTHKLSFPALHGLKAWGNYTRTSRGLKINVCAKDTARGVFAVGAVTLASNASNSRHMELGAVAIGYNQTVCRSETLRYTNHLRVWTFTAGNQGRITKRSKTKTVF